MLYAGTNIQSVSDKLMKVSVEYLFHSVNNPKPEVATMVRQLRTVRTLDSKKYSQLKRQLPYVVCGCFTPPFRKIENFAYIEHFIVDLDHLSDKGLTVKMVKERLMMDDRVALMFTSPSEDGVKVLYNLKEKCYDASVYSMFYKEFVKRLGVMHGLEQVVDSCTSDVSRACFISIDEDAYHNPNAQGVDIYEYINMADTSALFDLKLQQEKEAKSKSVNALETPVEEVDSKDPDKDALALIRQRLAGKKAVMEQRNAVYVPEALEQVMEGLKIFVEDQGITMYEVINIQYGKKLRCKHGVKLGEVNLFYGKRGFNVVQSPRCGTSAELNEVVAEIVRIYLSEL